jgi:hypothetical protein
MIAISDPAQDVTNASSTNHNDAVNVSHDIYNVSIGTPYPDLSVEWWLPDYVSAYDYAVVEHAVVMCYIPDTEGPVVEVLTPINGLYLFGNLIRELNIAVPIVIGSITVEVSAVDNRSGIKEVLFYVDGQIKATVTNPPYTWSWEDFGFFIYNLGIQAYDTQNNYTPVTNAVIKIL